MIDFQPERMENGSIYYPTSDIRPALDSTATTGTPNSEVVPKREVMQKRQRQIGLAW